MSSKAPQRGRSSSGQHGRNAGGTSTSERKIQRRDISEGLIVPPIGTLDKPEATAGEDIVLKDVTHVGSYNWTNAKKPTIIVPGSPSIWRDRPLPFTIAPDKGIQFMDQNAFRMPSSPLYPLFRAVDVVAEENGRSVIWPEVDFVTDRNGLRKLLRWINNTADPFRIDMQLAGRRTVLLSRWEKQARVWADGKGYGFQFEKESTRKAPGCENGTSHHSIVKYDLGGLIIVVRFEVDACISERSDLGSPASSDIDNLAHTLSGVSVSTPTQPASIGIRASTTKLDVIKAGQRVPPNSVIEMTTMTTMTAKSGNKWRDRYAQLYLSQTPHYYIAMHRNGEFYEITKHRLGSKELEPEHKEAQGGFRRLRVLLEMIQDLVVEHGSTTMLSLVYRDKKLEIFKRDDQQGVVPDDVLVRFNV